MRGIGLTETVLEKVTEGLRPLGVGAAACGSEGTVLEAACVEEGAGAAAACVGRERGGVGALVVEDGLKGVSSRRMACSMGRLAALAGRGRSHMPSRRWSEMRSPAAVTARFL
jgi:hypothetical protein